MADAKAKDVLFSDPPQGHDDEGLRPDPLRPRGDAPTSPTCSPKHADTFERIGVNPNDGLADVLARVAELPGRRACGDRSPTSPPRWQRAPTLAMVDSDRGITNLHVPSDIIIDASMPPMIRDSGKMWNAAGELQDTKAVIPDSSYAGVYAAVVDDCRANGAFDPATLGSVPNVGLMAQTGRGVRLARQDVRDPRRRHRAGRRTAPATW